MHALRDSQLQGERSQTRLLVAGAAHQDQIEAGMRAMHARERAEQQVQSFLALECGHAEDEVPLPHGGGQAARSIDFAVEMVDIHAVMNRVHRLDSRPAKPRHVRR